MQTKKQTSNRQATHTTPATALFDASHQLVYSSPTFCQLLGYTPSELLDMDVPKMARLVYPEDRRSINDHLKTLDDLKVIESKEQLEFIRKNGTTALVNRTIKIGRDVEGHPIVVAMTLDEV